MATIARPRESVKNVKEDFFDSDKTSDPNAHMEGTRPRGGMGKSKPVIDESKLTNAGQYEGDNREQETVNQGTASDEPTAPSSGNQSGSDAVKADRKGAGEGLSFLEKEEIKRRDAFSVIKRKAINQGAEEILSCLEPSFANEFRIAAMEYGVKDIGIYILGILNRLAKEVDFTNPDFEVEWENGIVGYTDTLHCQYCGKEIVTPTKLRQKFCSNLCAKYHREQGETGVVYPDESVSTGPSEEEQERTAYEAELKRTGGE